MCGINYIVRTLANTSLTITLQRSILKIAVSEKAEPRDVYECTAWHSQDSSHDGAAPKSMAQPSPTPRAEWAQSREWKIADEVIIVSITMGT